MNAALVVTTEVPGCWGTQKGAWWRPQAWHRAQVLSKSRCQVVSWLDSSALDPKQGNQTILLETPRSPGAHPERSVPLHHFHVLRTFKLGSPPVLLWRCQHSPSRSFLPSAGASTHLVLPSADPPPHPSSIILLLLHAAPPHRCGPPGVWGQTSGSSQWPMQMKATPCY